ncbi:hypothetical protein FJTKL_10656 [Diaporthe vaccinii]|uniref:Uncharacterized protein n=1 Tax=Diaporthe vaccinii TaxID=105482 RepID=A0ABR4FB75_9PEZI
MWNRLSRLGLLCQPADNTSVEQTKDKKEQSSIFMRVAKTRSHHPLLQPRAGRSGRLTSSADLVVIQHVVSMRSLHPGSSWGTNKTKQSNLSEYDDPDVMPVYPCLYV